MNCKICGKPLGKGQIKYCSQSCHGKDSFLTHNQGRDKNLCWLFNVITEEELRDLYLTKLYSVNYIAKQKGVSFNVIKTRLALFGIKQRNIYDQKKIDSVLGRVIKAHKHQVVEGSNKRNRKNYLAIAKTNFAWECMRCGNKSTNDSFDLVVHHKDRNNRNNELSNLMVLCQTCHAYIHGKQDNHIRKWRDEHGRNKNIRHM